MIVKIGYLAYQEMTVEVDDKFKTIIDKDDPTFITELAEECMNTAKQCDMNYIDLCSIETEKGEIIAEW